MRVLASAVGAAAGAAKAGEVVPVVTRLRLVRPMFKDYEARGEAFRAAVEALA
jgi:UDP-N-acetylmuramoylalanine-D-glutamate ligase